jgi:hypothetical protein
MSVAESLTRAHLQQPSGQQQLGTSAEVRSRLIRAALPTGSTGNCPVQGSVNGEDRLMSIRRRKALKIQSDQRSQ